MVVAVAGADEHDGVVASERVPRLLAAHVPERGHDRAAGPRERRVDRLRGRRRDAPALALGPVAEHLMLWSTP